MRDTATPDRPLTVITVAGGVVLAVGAVVLGLGLAGKLGGGTLGGVLGGLLTCFVGIALLTPIVSRPIVGILGRALSWTAAGALGRRNSARNPRRTAITAAALMVSIALVTGISIIFASIRESTVELVDTGLDADLVISSDPLSGGLASIDPTSLDAVRKISGVETVVGLSVEPGQVNGQPDVLIAVDDVAAAIPMFRIEKVSGSLEPLAAGQTIVDDQTATEKGWQLGGTISIRMGREEPKPITIVGLYKRTGTVSGLLISPADAQASFVSKAPLRAYVGLRDGTSAESVLPQVREAIKDNPEINVSTVDEFVASAAQIFDIVLVFVQLLLGLAMIIAVLGIINTLALSMTERTREMGLLRAVGMRRGQVMWMVTVESVVISVFGALLGIAVGVGLGIAVFEALRDEGFTKLAFPWPLMVAYVIASVFVGLAAALIPAIRAARLDVLKAIAYE